MPEKKEGIQQPLGKSDRCSAYACVAWLKSGGGAEGVRAMGYQYCFNKH